MSAQRGTLLFALLLATPAAAHQVPVGVGSQTELELTPRRIRARFNMGFSSLIGLAELKRMDKDGDGVIRPAEQDAFVHGLG